MIRHSGSVVFKAETLTPVILEARENRCPVLLVKDHGLYMMSEDGGFDPETQKRLTLSYAEGFDPDRVEFDDWYEDLREICGGDDFCETIASDNAAFSDVIDNNRDLRVAFTPTQFRMSTHNK
ncbi:DUF3085 domain-containing protein [Citrobacter braakii]|nr:DUF3085 domain-containing protein [Citrobacter braakii]